MHGARHRMWCNHAMMCSIRSPGVWPWLVPLPGPSLRLPAISHQEPPRCAVATAANALDMGGGSIRQLFRECRRGRNDRGVRMASTGDQHRAIWQCRPQD